MTRWHMLVTGAAMLALLASCGHPTVDHGGTSGLNAAESALQGGSPAVALQVANDVLAGHPNSVDALCVQGDALAGLGRMDEAKVSYMAALRLDPGSGRAHLGLGRLLLASDPAEAEAQFQATLQRDPRDVNALSNLGIARDLRGRHTDAQRAYRQALDINPDMTSAQVNLALSLAMSGDNDGAARLMQPIATAPNASRKLRHDYAVVLAMAGRREEAEQILARDESPDEIRRFLDAVRTSGPAGVPAAVGAPTDNGVQVQLFVAPTEDAAQAEWQHLQAALPNVLAGHSALVIRNEQGAQAFWHLRTGGFADAGAARAFCDQLHAADAACVVVGR